MQTKRTGPIFVWKNMKSRDLTKEDEAIWGFWGAPYLVLPHISLLLSHVDRKFHNWWCEGFRYCRQDGMENSNPLCESYLRALGNSEAAISRRIRAAILEIKLSNKGRPVIKARTKWTVFPYCPNNFIFIKFSPPFAPPFYPRGGSVVIILVMFLRLWRNLHFFPSYCPRILGRWELGGLCVFFISTVIICSLFVNKIESNDRRICANAK